MPLQGEGQLPVPGISGIWGLRPNIALVVMPSCCAANPVQRSDKSAVLAKDCILMNASFWFGWFEVVEVEEKYI